MSREKPIEFVTTDIDAQITEVNNIDAGLYFELVKARKTAIKFLQDRTIPILDRAALYLDLASKLQKCIKKPAKIETCNISYSDKDFLLKRLEELKKGSDKKLRKYTRIASKNGKNTYTQCVLDAWIELFDSLEHIKPEWDGILKGLKSFSDVLTCEECFDLSGRQVGKDDFLALRAREQYEYEHLLVYYAFRYFLRSVFDGKIYEKAALSIIALCMQLYLGMAHIRENGEFDFENQITLMRIYSKETEHSEENLEEIFKRISKDKMFSYNTFMYLLLR